MAGSDKYEKASTNYDAWREQNKLKSEAENKEAVQRSIDANKRLMDNLAKRDMYNEAYGKASKAAAGQAAAQGAQAQSSARSAGMSKAQAAEMGSNAQQNAFANAIGQQQGMAQSAIGQQMGQQMDLTGQTNQLRMAGAGNTMTLNQNDMSNRMQKMGMDQAQDAAMWQRGKDVVGGVTEGVGTAVKTGAMFSDEATKDASQNNVDVDAILKRHYANRPKKRDFRSLIEERS